MSSIQTWFGKFLEPMESVVDQKLSDLVAYVQELEKRPANHRYENMHLFSKRLWGTEAWGVVPAKRQMPTYVLIEDLWDIAMDLFGIGSGLIDKEGHEELSVQFYALYADMIWEFLRTHGIERG